MESEVNDLTKAVEQLGVQDNQLIAYKGVGASNKWQSQHLNELGIDFSRKNDLKKALESFTSATKHDPFNAVAHYNKRFASKIKPNEVVNAKTKDHQLSNAKIQPYFLINMISHAPARSSSSDSSEEEEIDKELIPTFENIQQKSDRISFPYTTKVTTTKRRNNKIKKPNRIDSSIPKCKQIITSKLCDDILAKLSNNSFDRHDNGKNSQIRLSLALNRMKSVSSRKNQALSMEVDSNISQTDIQYEKFGFFWACQWYDENNNTVKYSEVKHFYKQLKKWNKSLAKQFLEQEENQFEQNRSNIPYRDLREAAKDHEKTKLLVREIRSQDSNATIYLCFMDGDVIDFNGMFSAYSRIVQGCFELPTVMSTGYEYPLDSDYGAAYQLLGKMDRMIRVLTTFHIPLGTYYPEPNLCVLIPNNCLTVPESFLSKKRDGNMLESSVLLEDMQIKRPNSTFIFSEDKPLITSIPSRAKQYKAPRAKSPSDIKFSPEFKSSLASPLYDDIKGFDKVSQSNTNGWNWIHNLFTNSSIKINSEYHDENDPYCYPNGKKTDVRCQCISIISKLCKSQPDDMQNSLKDALFMRITDRSVAEQILDVIKAREDYIKYFSDQNERTAEEKELFDIIRSNDINLDNVTRETVLIMSSEPILELIRTGDDEYPILDIDQLIELDTTTLRYILENESVIQAFKDSKVDNDILMQLLTEYFEEFEKAHNDNEYSVEDIVNKYNENPLHLDFMSNDPDEFVYENSDDFEIVAFGIKYYDIDVNYISRSQDSETARIIFDANVEWYYQDEYGYQEENEYPDIDIYEDRMNIDSDII